MSNKDKVYRIEVTQTVRSRKTYEVEAENEHEARSLHIDHLCEHILGCNRDDIIERKIDIWEKK